MTLPAPHQADRPLTGISVVEFGSMAAAAACGAQLAAFGADVVKLEPPWGDHGRGAGAAAKTLDGGRRVNPRFELHNRGKRSVAIDLSDSRGRSLVLRLVERADVFVTNALPRVLRKFGLTYDDLAAVSDRLVYGHITGYGRGTPDEDRASFDHGAFWAQSGLAAYFADSRGVPPAPSGGLGDRTAGIALAAAVCGALVGRERTGRGMLVSTSLLRTGLWMQGSVLSDALFNGISPTHEQRRAAMPTLNSFRCADGRWLFLQVMNPERDWPALVRALDHPSIRLDDYGGGSRAELRSRSNEALASLETVFSKRALAEWSGRLDREGVRFEPVLDHADVIGGSRAAAARAFINSEHPDLPRAIADPCTLGEDESSVPRAADVGADTLEVLAELEVPGTQIAALVADGVVCSPKGAGDG